MKNAPFVASYGPVISNGTIGSQPSVFLSNGLPTPVRHRSGEPERRRHRRRSELQVHARAAVQPDRREGVRRQRARRRLCRFSRRPRAAERGRGRSGHQPGAGRAGRCGRTPRLRGARAESHEHQHAASASTNRRTTRCSWCSSAAITPASRSTRTTRWRTTCGRDRRRGMPRSSSATTPTTTCVTGSGSSSTTSCRGDDR